MPMPFEGSRCSMHALKGFLDVVGHERVGQECRCYKKVRSDGVVILGAMQSL